MTAMREVELNAGVEVFPAETVDQTTREVRIDAADVAVVSRSLIESGLGIYEFVSVLVIEVVGAFDDAVALTSEAPTSTMKGAVPKRR